MENNTSENPIFKTNRGMLHAIYWKLHTAFLLNERERAKYLLDMLVHSNQDAVLSEIGSIHFERFQIIQERIEQNCFGRIYGSGFETPEINQPILNVEKSGPEREFCKKLMGVGKDYLRKIVEAGPKASIVDELEMGIYGRADFVIRDCRIIHAIEIKMGSCPSSAVSQIDRYVLALNLDMCLGAFDEVTATVMAESFPPYVAAELSRLGVHMVIHDGSIDNLRKIC